MTEIPSNHWLNAIGRGGARGGRMAATPPSYPIAEAPAMPGKPFGPILLWPGDEQGNWRFGRWNGVEWANDDDFIVYPLRYALLPDVPAGEALPLPAPAARSIESDAVAMLPAIAAGAPLDGRVLALHRRWSALLDEKEKLDREISDRKFAAGLREPRAESSRHGPLFSEAAIDKACDWDRGTWPRLYHRIEKQRAAMKVQLAASRQEYEAGIKRHGIAALAARYDAVAAQINDVCDVIAAMPIRTIEDLAVWLDIAIHQELEPPFPKELLDHWPWMLTLMRAIAVLASGFAFTSLRRYVHGFDIPLDAGGVPISPAPDPV